MDLDKLKYPIGKYTPNNAPGDQQLQQWINEIEHFPSKVEELTRGISVETLNWKYRPDGWTIKQVIHHCADSHMNSIIRFKLALTEDTPAIRPYYEDKWARLTDSLSDDIEDSLTLLKALHKKWILLLKGLSKEDLKREFIHPEYGTKINLAQNIGIYAWHCRHHLAHIRSGLNSEGKYN